MPEPTEVVRSRGYGPSTDLLKGVPPTAPLEVQTTTLLHPHDTDIQQRVLAFSRPSPAHVTVLTAPETASSLTYRTLPYHPPPLSAPRGDSHDDTSRRSSSLAAVHTQLAVMEEALQDRLTTAANLIVAQVAEHTDRQLHTLEMAQSAESTTLAQLIMNCVQDELQHRLAEEHAAKEQPSLLLQQERRRDDDEAAAEAVATRTASAVETTVSRVVERVVAEVEKAVQAAEARSSNVAQQLENRMNTYFTQLQTDMMHALDAPHKTDATRSSSSTTDADTESRQSDDADRTQATLSDSLRQELTEMMAQATRVQHDRLSAMLETMLDRQGGTGALAAESDRRALHDIIEGSLQHASDNIRLSVVAEVKKLAKASAKGGGAAGKAQDEVLPEALAQNLSDSIDEAIASSQMTLKRLRETDGTVKEMHQEQARLYELTAQLRDMLLQQQQQQQQHEHEHARTQREMQAALSTAARLPKQHRDEVEAAAARQTEDALSLMHEVKDCVERLSGVVQARADSKEHDLVTTAQAVSDSVSAALEARTQEAVEGAMREVQQHMTELMSESMTRLMQTQMTRTRTAEEEEEEERKNAASALLTQERIVQAVKEILSPPLQLILTRLEHAEQEGRHRSEEHMLTMAKTLSEAVQAAMAERAHSTDDDKDKDDVSAALQERLTRMQKELIESVQQEMGKTHEVDLTPMYRYIDGLMAFVKEELVQQNRLLTTQQQQSQQHLQDQLTAMTERLTTATREGRATDAAQWASAQEQLRAAQTSALSAATEHMTQQLEQTLSSELTQSLQRALDSHNNNNNNTAPASVQQGSEELVLQHVKTELQGWRRAQEQMAAEQRDWLERTVQKAVEEMAHKTRAPATRQAADATDAEQAYRDTVERMASERHQEVLDMIQSCVAATPEELREHLRSLRAAVQEDSRSSTQHMLDKVEAMLAAHATSAKPRAATTDERDQQEQPDALSSLSVSLGDEEAARQRASILDELKRIHVALSEQGGILHTLSQHDAAGQRAPEQHGSAEVKQLSTEVDRVRAEMQTAMEHVQTVLRQLGSARGGEAVQALLQRLRAHMADVQLLQVQSAELQSRAMQALTRPLHRPAGADAPSETATTNTALSNDTPTTSEVGETASSSPAAPAALRGALETMQTEMLQHVQQLSQQMTAVEQQQEVVHDNIIDTITRVVAEMRESMEQQRLAEQQQKAAEAAEAAAAAAAKAEAEAAKAAAGPRPASVQDIHEALHAREAAMQSQWQKGQRKTAEILRDVAAETVSIRASHAAMQRAMQEHMDATARGQRTHWEETLQHDATQRRRELGETLQSTVLAPLQTTMRQMHKEAERAQQTALDSVVSRAMTQAASEAAVAVSHTMRDAVREQRDAVTAASEAAVASAASAQAVANSTKHWLTTEAASLQRALATPAASTTRSSLPLWWLLLNPLLTLLSMLLCGYLLFATFLLAFVPLPDGASPTVSGTAATDAAGDASTVSTTPIIEAEQVAPPPPPPLSLPIQVVQQVRPSPSAQPVQQAQTRSASTMPPSKRVVDSLS